MEGRDEQVDLLWARGLTGAPLKLSKICAKAPPKIQAVSSIYSFDAVRGRSEMGQGAFSVVVEKATHKASGTPVAVKMVSKDLVGPDYLRNHIDRGVFGLLLDMSKDRAHPNVIKFLDFLTTPSFAFVFMEPMAGPNLCQALEARAPVTEAFCRQATESMLKALAHLERILIHRDVKLENLVFRTPSTDAPLVLIDFGLACPAEPLVEPRDIAGTMIYAAPEVFSHVYGPPVDVWSAGVVLYIMLTGRPPAFDPETLHHPGDMMEHMLGDALAAPELHVAPALGTDLLRKLLVVDPTARLAASKAVDHDWLRLVKVQSRKDLSKGATMKISKDAYRSVFARTGKSAAFRVPKHAMSIAEAGGSRSLPWEDEEMPLRAPRVRPVPLAAGTLQVAEPPASGPGLVGLAVGGLAIAAAFRFKERGFPISATSVGLVLPTWLGGLQGLALRVDGGVLAGAAIGVLAALLPASVRWAFAFQPVQLQDGPTELVLKARKIRHPRVRAEMLGEVRMLGKKEFSLSPKDFIEVKEDVNVAIEQQLTKEAGPVRLVNAPPMGSLTMMSRVLWKDSQMYYHKIGKLVMVRIFSRNVLFLSDSTLTEEILNGNPKIAPHQTGWNLQLQQRLDGYDLAFTNMGHAWRRRRKATHAAFVQQIPHIAQHAVTEAQRLCKRILNKVGNISGQVDIIREFRMILIQTLANALYGTGFTEAEANTLDLELKAIFDLAVALDPFDFSDFFEALPPHVTYRRRMNERMDKIMALHTRHFERIRASFDPRQPATCVLEEYLKLMGGDPSSKLSGLEVLAMMHNIFSAGVDSTSVSGPWTVAFLLNNHQVVKQVQVEVDAATDGCTRWLRRDDLQNLPLLAACFKESVRMRPPFPVLSRMTSSESQELGGYTIPPFTQIVLGIYTMNNLEENFTEALSWKPERWLQEGSKLYPRKLRVFGGGPRICPGAQLAFENVQLLLGSVLQNFDVTQTPPPDVGLEGNSYSMPPKHFLMEVSLRPRALVTKIENARLLRESMRQDAPKAGSGAPGSDPKSGGTAPIHVFYCSTTGTAEQMALGLKSTASAAGVTVNVANLDEWSGSELADMAGTPCVFVASTYYNGEPPDSGRKFHNWLTSQPDGKLKGLRFAVFANGNSQYEHYNWMGKEVERQLLRLGGDKVVEIGLGDASEDAETAWDVWQASLLGVIAPTASSDGALDAAKPPCDWCIEWQEAGHSPARIRRADSAMKGGLALESRGELRDDTSEGSCLELLFRLDGPTYDTAQNLLLYPENSTSMVERMAAVMHPPCTADLDRPFSLRWVGEGKVSAELPVSLPTTLRKVLTRECDLVSKPKKSLLRDLAGCATDAFEREAMRVLLAPSGAEWFELKTAKGLTLIDFLEEYPSIQLSAESLLTLLPSFRIQPRRYTISSSPLVDARLLRLTVTMHDRLLVGGKVFGGLCTHWLRDLPLGSEVRATVQPSGFVPPSLAASPIIMVGAGSGIAPIIAFLEMRETLKLQGKELGDAAIFFGCRNRDRDYIYRDRLESWKLLGVITELIPAFSRPGSGGTKAYVQDAVAAHGTTLKAMFERGAYFYICGATAMGMAVRDALVSGGALIDVAAAKALEEQGRYVQELWS